MLYDQSKSRKRKGKERKRRVKQFFVYDLIFGHISASEHRNMGGVRVSRVIRSAFWNYTQVRKHKWLLFSDTHCLFCQFMMAVVASIIKEPNKRLWKTMDLSLASDSV